MMVQPPLVDSLLGKKNVLFEARRSAKGLLWASAGCRDRSPLNGVFQEHIVRFFAKFR